MARLVTGLSFGAALVAAGVLTQEELNDTRRVVIDSGINPLAPVVMYIERYADEKILDVATTLKGIQITREDRPDGRNAEEVPG